MLCPKPKKYSIIRIISDNYIPPANRLFTLLRDQAYPSQIDNNANDINESPAFELFNLIDKCKC